MTDGIIEIKKKYITLNIEGEKYNINTKIYIGKLIQYIEDIENNINFKKAFENLIELEKLDIVNINQNDEIKIMQAIINDNDLQEYYDKIDCSDEYEKFSKVITNYQKMIAQRFAKALQPALESLGSIIKPFLELDYTKIFSRISDSLIKFQESLLETYKKINVSFPTKEEIEKKKNKYVKWAKFGWTMLPNAPLDFFDKVPNKQNEADKICIELLNNNEMLKIFKYIKIKSKCKKQLNEAINCYKQGYYTATAMILTANIERELTELLIHNKTDNKPRGKSIINKFKNNIEYESQTLIEYYMFSNLVEYLNNFFENGNDFKRQRYNVNRNFLMHGWRNVKTTEVDCKKLFLSLHNIFFFYEINKDV